MAFENNYTKNINFKGIKRNPLYLRIAKVLVDHPGGITRHGALKIANPNRKFTQAQVSRGWECGPFTLLKDNGYAFYVRRGRKVLWHPTALTPMFVASNS